MSEYSVELKGLNKVYSNLLKEDTIALKDINLQIRPWEFISIIGPSGCGKSTLYGSLETLINRPPVRSSNATGQTSRWDSYFRIPFFSRGRM